MGVASNKDIPFLKRVFWKLGVSLGYTLKGAPKWHIPTQYSFTKHQSLVSSLYSLLETFLPCSQLLGQKPRKWNRKVTKTAQIGNLLLI